jgi:hypothetical protein
MISLLRSVVSFGALLGLLATTVLLGIVNGAVAQDSTPDSGRMPISDCVAALGIGMAGDACIDVIHASPDAPMVDVYLDGALAIEIFAIGSFSGWVPVPAGDHQVQVVPTGEDVSAAVIDATATLESGMAYHIAATGAVSEIAAQIYQADLSDLAESDARIRVIHISPDAPAVDIALKGGDVLISNLDFPAASDVLVVPAGTYDLEVRPTGTLDVALDLSGVVLEAGMVYDVFAIGTVADGTLSVLVVPSTTPATVATPAS